METRGDASDALEGNLDTVQMFNKQKLHECEMSISIFLSLNKMSGSALFISLQSSQKLQMNKNHLDHTCITHCYSKLQVNHVSDML